MLELGAIPHLYLYDFFHPELVRDWKASNCFTSTAGNFYSWSIFSNQINYKCAANQQFTIIHGAMAVNEEPRKVGAVPTAATTTKRETKKREQRQLEKHWTS